jgi:hypothetical protein
MNRPRGQLLNAWFNAADFALAAPGRFGDSPKSGAAW